MNLLNRLKDIHNKIKVSVSSISTSLLKKTVITALAVSAISIHTVSASEENGMFETVYHVYMNDTYIGTVSDQSVINQVIADKMSEYKEKYGNYEFELGKDVTYIPEFVYRKSVDNERTAEKLRETLSVETEAVAIVVNDKPAVYVKSKEDADKVLEQLKLSYVSAEQLKLIEEQKASNQPLPPLKESESRIIDVQMVEDVKLETQMVEPSQLMSVEDTVNYLKKGTLEEKKYVVQEGEVLGSIASKHNLSLKQLLALNPGVTEDTLLQIGQELNVTVYEPLVHIVVQKEVNKKETIPYKKEVIEDKSLFKGETRVKQEGQNGERSVTYVITETNGIQTSKQIKEDKILKEPVNHIVIKGTKVIPSRGTGNFSWPTVGGYISSKQGYRWGKFHKGIDIARPSNYTIKAADNGVVTFAGWDGGYGKKIVINHKNGFKTVYAHLNTINVSVGQTVSKGQKIGVMGSTGNSTGTHLHFEVYKNGALQNPLDYLH
jgi:murein DD-endopeptidase MepM/ murein hydrolase activator NlpD